MNYTHFFTKEKVMLHDVAFKNICSNSLYIKLQEGSVLLFNMAGNFVELTVQKLPPLKAMFMEYAKH